LLLKSVLAAKTFLDKELEKSDTWNTSDKNIRCLFLQVPAVINETVLTAKEYLDKELEKYETWEDACADKSIITKLVDNAKAFVKLRDQKAGRETILKFLCGNWKGKVNRKNIFKMAGIMLTSR